MTVKNYGLVTSIEELSQLADRLLTGNTSIGLDIESGYLGPPKDKYSLHPETAIVVGISFTNSTDWARYAPLRHDSGDNLDNRQAARILWPVLNSGRGVAHNATFELRHLSKWFRELLAEDPDYGEQVRATDGYFPVRSDTQIEAYLAADFQSFGLKYLTRMMFDRQGRPVPKSRWPERIRQYTALGDKIRKTKEHDEQQRLEASFDGHRMTELHELFPGLAQNKRKTLRFNVLDQHDPAVYSYACEDSLWCLGIHQQYYAQLRDTLLYKVEMGVLNCVCEMEEFGVRYDWAAMRRAAEEVRNFRDQFNAEIMRELSEMTGEPTAVNLASPAKVSELLFTKLGMRTTVYTATTRELPPEQRKMSTGKVALAGLAKKHPVVQKIREWKEMTRLLGTYLEKYEGLYQYAPDGMTHPNHLSAVVVTGRFAVADPPYQQSPKRYHFDLSPAKAAHAAHAEAHGPRCKCDDPAFTPPPGTCFSFNFRDCIVAPPDHYIIGFDLSQAELRAIAGEAQEPALLKAFTEGEDVHTRTAALMLGLSIEDVTKDIRDIGKTMNFALGYGMQVKGMADRLGISVEEAQVLFDKYAAALPVLAAWKTKQIEQGRRNGFVVSKFGRRLPIWEYQSDKRWIREKGDRACINYPIQGCLPSDTRVLTRVGWVPIGEFEDGDDVWTGAEWAPAVRLNMGPAPRVRLHLSDGRTFDCDDRHRLLVKADPWPEWKLVTEAKGLPLCQDQNTDWGEPDTSTVEDWYWVGRFVGDGSLHRSNQGHVRWCMSFDGVKEAEDIERFKAWLGTRFQGRTKTSPGYSVDDGPIRRGTGKGVKVVGGTKTGVGFWQAHGIQIGAAAKTLRIPEQVFRLDLAGRRAFCEGYLDADGNVKYDAVMSDGTITRRAEGYWSKLTSASREGLEDMLRLFQTVGRTGRIGKAVVLAGRGAGGSDHVFWDLWLHRAPKELVIEDIEYLPEEPMFTLSVYHPRHAFSSEGLISKNSATGDYVKLAMVRARKALRAAGLADRVHLVMNIHDALEFYVHRSVQPIDVIRVLKPAVVFSVNGWPEMKADWHIAKKWGSPVEVDYTDDGRLIVKGDKEFELVPAVEQDEDGEEIVVMPEVDPEMLRRVAAREEPRTVIVDLAQMPSSDAYRRFLEYLDAREGPHSVLLRTPEGELSFNDTDISTRDTAALSLVLGPVTITYHADSIDTAELVQGLTL